MLRITNALFRALFINYIRSTGLQHHPVRAFFNDSEAAYGDIVYFALMHWLSRSSFLKRFLSKARQLSYRRTNQCACSSAWSQMGDGTSIFQSEASWMHSWKTRGSKPTGAHVTADFECECTFHKTETLGSKTHWENHQQLPNMQACYKRELSMLLPLKAYNRTFLT